MKIIIIIVIIIVGFYCKLLVVIPGTFANNVYCQLLSIHPVVLMWISFDIFKLTKIIQFIELI